MKSGETVFNTKKLIQGQSGGELTELGEKQALVLISLYRIHSC